MFTYTLFSSLLWFQKFCSLFTALVTLDAGNLLCPGLDTSFACYASAYRGHGAARRLQSRQVNQQFYSSWLFPVVSLRLCQFSLSFGMVLRVITVMILLSRFSVPQYSVKVDFIYIMVSIINCNMYSSAFIESICRLPFTVDWDRGPESGVSL